MHFPAVSNGWSNSWSRHCFGNWGLLLKSCGEHRHHSTKVRKYLTGRSELKYICNFAYWRSEDKSDEKTKAYLLRERMPPKKKEQPKTTKVAVDKTFGLKNVLIFLYFWLPARLLLQKNKSKKVQQFVQQVQQQQAATGISAKAKVILNLHEMTNAT